MGGWVKSQNNFRTVVDPLTGSVDRGTQSLAQHVGSPQLNPRPSATLRIHLSTITQRHFAKIMGKAPQRALGARHVAMFMTFLTVPHPAQIVQARLRLTPALAQRAQCEWWIRGCLSQS